MIRVRIFLLFVALISQEVYGQLDLIKHDVKCQCWRTNWDTIATYTISKKYGNVGGLETVYDSAEFANSQFERARFSAATFRSIAFFGSARFKQGAYFRENTFEDSVFFYDTEFENKAAFSRCQFNSFAEFSRANFDSVYFEYSFFYGNVNFPDALFNRVIFRGARFFKNANFERIHIQREALFASGRFKGRTLFENSEIKKVLDFTEAEFGSFLGLSHAMLGEGINFSGAVLPDSLDFSYAIIGQVIDLTVANFDSAKTCNVNLIGTEVSKIKLDYLKFKLYFPDSTSPDLKSSVYEKLKSKFEDEGLRESYKLLDIEHRQFEYENKASGFWHFVNAIDRWWWNYGHNKEYVFLNTLFLFMTFFMINWVFFDYLVHKVYSIHNIMAAARKTKYLKTFKLRGKKIRIAFPHRATIVLCSYYTAMIFFGIKMNNEDIHYENKWPVAYIYIQYTIGLVCVAYLANFVITR